MKKLIFPILCGCAMAFSACSNNDNDITPATPAIAADSDKPATEIFVQGQRLDEAAQTKGAFAQTRVNIPEEPQTYAKYPYANTAEGWEVARFSIRVDGTIPGYIDQSSTLYYGLPVGRQGKNRGRVSSAYPYGRYNDRDYDYSKVSQKTGNNIGLFRYVLDPDKDSHKAQLAILEQPSVVDILQDEIDDKKKNLDKAYEWMALEAANPGYLDKHVHWYVVKEVAGKGYWHVNGVFVNLDDPDYVVPDARANGFANVPNDVEIDIHQQIHQDWNEIKTSIHIRTDCESVKINIPLAYEDIVEQDDFAIRVYDFYYKEYVISHTITHDANGITIEISNIPATLIQELKDNYGDGLTVEIHSYCTTDDIWEQLSRSKVTKLGKPCTVKGQITTAYDPEKKQLIYAPKN